MLQRVANYLPPIWPGTAVIHFDLTPPSGGTLDQSVAGALAAGASWQPIRLTLAGWYSLTPPVTPFA